MPYCRSREGWGPVSALRDFDLTPCFEEGILLSAVAFTILVASVFRLHALSNLSILPKQGRRSELVLYVKVSLWLSGFAISVGSAIWMRVGSVDVAVRESYYLEAFALVIIPGYTIMNHRRTRRASTTLLVLWPLYALSLVVWGRTVIESSETRGLRIVLVLRAALLGTGSCALLLESLGPELHDGGPIQLAEDSHESPYMTASFYSRMFFCWMSNLMRRGASKFITEEDLPSLSATDESAYLGERLQSRLKNHSLFVALVSAFGGPYGFAAILKLLQDALAFLQPQLLRLLLTFIAEYQSHRDRGLKPPTPIQGFSIAILMFLTGLTQSVLLHQYFQRCFETGMRVRAGLVSVIYRKALVLAPNGTSSSSGDIVNLMSVDATRLQDFCTFGVIALSGPFQIILAFVSLYNLLGWPAFVGVLIMVFSIPLNTLVARYMKRLQEQQMKNRDARTRLMNEVLANMKSIKLYAWEDAFTERILQVRNRRELRMLRKIGIVTALNGTMWSGIPLLVAFASFATAASTSDRPITPDVIFPAISLFMLLQFPLAMFSQVTSNIIEALVSVKRLTEFLHADELQEDAREVLQTAELRESDAVLEIQGADFSWQRESIKPDLQEIDLSVKSGELVGIFGRVGSGKSSLLSAITGDLVRTDGIVRVSGSIAYASQNPWIMSNTVRENILFSHSFNEEFYNAVIDACALKSDLKLLSEGDMTVVGEKGITLSGGQKARVALARAVYARADLYLLDDVLAAVDSHVARHVFDRVIGPFGLLANKARIHVTNSLSFVRQHDQLIYMRRGIILERGLVRDILNDPEKELSKLSKGYGSLSKSSGASTPRSPITSGSGSHLSPSVRSPLDSEKASWLDEKLAQRRDFQKATLQEPQTTRELTAELSMSVEHREQGRVKKTVYAEYLKAASVIGFAFFLLCAIGQQAASIASNITLKAWGDHNQSAGGNTALSTYLIIYGVFSLSSTILSGASSILIWVFCSLRSAKHLHDSVCPQNTHGKDRNLIITVSKMLAALMRAPLSYFEQTPSGRILNLFSRDTYVIDQILARVIQNTVRTILTCVGILLVIAVSFPWFLVAVPPLGYCYYMVMIYYLATSRELKRLDAVSRSPIFAWFGETLSGLPTIRAFGQQGIFVRKISQRVDRNQMCYLPSICVNRWLAIRLELVGAIIIFVAAVLGLVALITTGVDSGLVGLVLSYGLNTTSSLNWVVRSLSEVEQNIVSVERVQHNTELAPEAPYDIPDSQPGAEWPNDGRVQFKDYSMRYRPELEPILKSIDLEVKGHEKIGICGRTGAGKSSLLLALFRILEPASGTIKIDGVDITTLGLKNLRSAMSIVPQSPDLFQGTIRDNVDPAAAHDDAEIWGVLDRLSYFKEYVQSLESGLDSHVGEGGSSLSAGQRQLLCFARALLRKSRILVLDEATSAIDVETDRAIQDVIRGPTFAKVTMFIIAHRLNTILDCDRVLVLGDGKVVEFDKPDVLLSKTDSAFHSLAQEAGLV